MEMQQALWTDWMSPCGRITMADMAGRLVMADWTDGWHHATVTRRIERRAKVFFVEGRTPLIDRTIEELEAYFAGERRTFDLPLAYYGTDFQIRVWRALERIPYGRLVTYADIAREAGSPRATRAAGVAVGENPFTIIVPCHRVVGRDGTLTGYGGGYAAKRRLLALEMGVAEDAIGFENGAEKHGRAGFE